MTGDGSVGINVSSPSRVLELGKDEATKPASFAWSVDADQRLVDKLEMANLDTCYANIKDMPLRSFKWRSDVYSDDDVRDRHVIGWTADDVASFFPKAVSVREAHGLDDCKLLDVSQIVAAMHGTIQKIQHAVEAQEKRIASLESAPRQQSVIVKKDDDVFEMRARLNEYRDVGDDHQLQLDAIKSEIIQLRKTCMNALRSRETI